MDTRGRGLPYGVYGLMWRGGGNGLVWGGGETTTETKRNSVAPTEARGVCKHSSTVFAEVWLIPRDGRPPERGSDASPREEKRIRGGGLDEESGRREGAEAWTTALVLCNWSQAFVSGRLKRACAFQRGEKRVTIDERRPTFCHLRHWSEWPQENITYDTFLFNIKRRGIYNLPLNSADTHASANRKLKLTLQRMRR